MARYPAQLQSANLNEFGIVYADEIQGHKTVATLNTLYAITDPILSKSVVNTNNDAIGQEWFVVSEDCYYRLDNWANRHAASGWTKLQVVDTEFNSLSTHGADKIKNFTTSPNTVTLNYNTWRSSTVNEDGTAVINAATQSAAGVLSAADKTKLDGLNTDSINDISVTSNANKATITFVSDNGNKEDISTTIDFPISTSTAAGTMSAKDKTELDRINTANFALGAVTPAASTVGIAASKTNVTDGTTAANNITLPAATQSAAGVMTATDKQNLDVNIPNRITNLDNRVTTEVNRIEELIENSSNDIINDLNVEIQARKDGDNQLQTNINNLQSTMNTELDKKVGKVTVAGSGNAVTTASISGDTLTLTKGATYNNYVHPAGSAPSKASGFYKFSTDSTSHVASVTAVTKQDITDLGIADADTTPKVVDIGYKSDYEYVVILLWKDNEVATHRVDGLFYTTMNGSARRQIADAHLWFSRWGSNSEYSYIFNVGGQGSSFQFISCTYNGVKWWGIQHTNDQAVRFWFNGTYDNTQFTLVKYYNRNTSTVLNSEINGSIQNENSKVSRYTKAGNPYAFLSEVNTKVSKSGDTMTGNLNLSNSVISTTITTDGNHNVKIGSAVTGGWARGYNFSNNSGTILAAIGCTGGGQTLNYAYIGSTYENTWQRWSSSGSTVTVPLTTAAITSSGKVSASGGFFKESDARLKSDIKPLDYTLDQICSIPTVSFIMNDQKQIGTIAQNLEELGFEDIVTEGDTLKSEVNNPEQFESFTKDGEEYVKVKKVEYEMLGVLAIEGVKMLKDEIEKLKAEIETLKNKQHE